MIIRTVHGRSFKGVGLYVLHDKQAQTDDRVAFTNVVNIPTENPRVALAMMINTAAHANDLKRAAGVKIGKTIERPVYHYTLSWEVNEAPTKADQVEAAKDSLQALGIDNRQALIVAHTDTDNPHVHVVVNKVCPETGRVATLGNDRLKLSNWAEDYRHRHGQDHFCPQRKINNDRRRAGEWVKDQTSLTRQEWMAWKKAQTKELWDAYRADKNQAQPERRMQYEALWRRKGEIYAAYREDIKQLYKPIWRDVFARHRRELAGFDSGLMGRINFVLTQPASAGSKLQGLVMAIAGKRELRAELLRKQQAERKDIGDGQKQRVRVAGQEVTDRWQQERHALRSHFRREDETALDVVKERVRDVWKDKAIPPVNDNFKERQSSPVNETVQDGYSDKLRQKRERGQRNRNRPRRRPR